MIDLDELERLAKSATPGPWNIEKEIKNNGTYYVTDSDNYAAIGKLFNYKLTDKGIDNVAFVAAFNPSVAQELINRLREAEKDAERLSFAYSQRHTNSMELVDLEMRLINGDNPSIEEVRMAIDDAMEQEQNNG